MLGLGVRGSWLTGWRLGALTPAPTLADPGLRSSRRRLVRLVYTQLPSELPDDFWLWAPDGGEGGRCHRRPRRDPRR